MFNEKCYSYPDSCLFVWFLILFFMFIILLLHLVLFLLFLFLILFFLLVIFFLLLILFYRVLGLHGGLQSRSEDWSRLTRSSTSGNVQGKRL